MNTNPQPNLLQPEYDPNRSNPGRIQPGRQEEGDTPFQPSRREDQPDRTDVEREREPAPMPSATAADNDNTEPSYGDGESEAGVRGYGQEDDRNVPSTGGSRPSTDDAGVTSNPGTGTSHHTSAEPSGSPARTGSTGDTALGGHGR